MPNAFLARQPIYDRMLEVFGKVDAELVEAARHLSGQGCTIALDDFVYDETLRPLVELADIIKIDVLSLDRAELKRHVALLRKFGAKLLAEKVETQDDYAFCRDLGFDYFQGYFFCVLAYDRGNWGEARYAELSTSEVTQTYLDAIAWAGQVAQALLVDNGPSPPTHR